jgi:3-oxoacyl-[acyl-carrier-protein] synthase-1
MFAAGMQPAVITAYSLCNCMGVTTAEVLAALAAGRSGLGPCPAEFGLAWPATVGVVPGELPALPTRLADYDTRQARIAALALEEMRGPLARACRRWGSDRVAVVLGTSTGGIGASEVAYAFHARHGALPPGFTAERSHALDAAVPVVCRRSTGLAGPGYVLSTACSSSAQGVRGGAAAARCSGCATRRWSAGSTACAS